MEMEKSNQALTHSCTPLPVREPWREGQQTGVTNVS
jgi:hypothetical protein